MGSIRLALLLNHQISYDSFKSTLTLAVVEDGYGLSYEINDDSIRWCVTTKNNNAAEFGEALCSAAEEIRGMMERVKAGAEGKR